MVFKDFKDERVMRISLRNGYSIFQDSLERTQRMIPCNQNFTVRTSIAQMVIVLWQYNRGMWLLSLKG